MLVQLQLAVGWCYLSVLYDVRRKARDLKGMAQPALVAKRLELARRFAWCGAAARRWAGRGARTVASELGDGGAEGRGAGSGGARGAGAAVWRRGAAF